MPNIEWDVPHTILTPGGNVDLNTAAGRRYIIQHADYKIVPSLRVTQDNISQADGSVLHPRWKTGLVATIRVAYWMTGPAGSVNPAAEDEPACGADQRIMHQDIVQALNSIRRLTGAAQRLVWAPTGYGDLRMLDQIQLLSWPEPSYDLDGGEASVVFSVESPFPYALDFTETTTHVGSGSSGGTNTISNVGNADFSPVAKVYGPTTSFTLTNESDLDESGNPLKVVYDAGRPGGIAIGGSDYAEIDFFRGTIYKNGNGANLIAGIDPTTTDFWHLLTTGFLGGPNVISITGANVDILWNNAWA